MTFLLRTAGGALLVALPGFAALRGAPWSRSMTRSGRWALASCAGLALAVPVALAAALAEVPLRGRVIAAIDLLLALALRLLVKAPAGEPGRIRPPRSRLAIMTRFLLAAAAAVFLAKIARVPVWSWDYYAVHGTRARRIFAEKKFDASGLDLPSFAVSHSDYPLGVPVAWRLLALGATPDDRSVKLAHLFFAFALLALAREGVLAALGSEPVANTAAAFVAISPLLWDTESLGLMEVPLALFLAAAFLVFLELAKGPPRGGEWIWGAVAGFLPWIKLREGLTLAALLSIALLVSGRAARSLRAVLAATLWAAAALGVSIFLLPRGESFLAGAWLERFLSRLRHPGPIVALLAKELLAREWFGFWILFAAGAAYSVVRKRRTAALLAGVIAAQVAAYAAVYFFTYLDPQPHIRSSFFRIVAALLPAGLIALAAAPDRSFPEHTPFPRGEP